MSAPTATVPLHHQKGDICDTRPAYREGRQPKAVKVFTINQESVYILVQGVPTVGASEELVKLCAVYGPVEEYRILDDYPAEDYTEVYLIKYKKIQSARFAKRKLDDYSFFGGVLHVCYAPEFESVDETRSKLQDRRKVIAAKIRKAKETEASQTKTDANVSEGGDHVKPNTSQNVTEQRVPPIENVQQTQNNASWEKLSQVQNNTGHVMGTEPPSSQGEGHKHGRGDDSYVYMNFELPPPPMHIHPGHQGHRHRNLRNEYEYAWVPSSHSTLPPRFDGRQDSGNSNSTTDPNVQHENKKGKEKIVNGLVVREYKLPAKKVPKFVPRQAVKKDVTESSSSDNKKKESISNDLSKELRVNAFTLGQTQGPIKPGAGDLKLNVAPSAQLSVNQSVKEIRKRISKFISEKVPQAKKRKEENI